MSIDSFSYPDKTLVNGPLVIQGDVTGSSNKGTLSTDNGALVTDGAGNLTAVSLTTSGGIVSNGTFSGGQQTGTVTTLSTGNTITPGTSGGNGSVRVTAGAAVTGIILAAGTKAGQEITVIHEGAAANTITFAASGTSNVADGVSDVITGPSARTFIWDAVTSLWYKMA